MLERGRSVILDGEELLPAVVAAALLGAIVGFAPFNKPVARLFLGDVGSLPMGLLLGWLLLQLAGEGHVAAAVILPLYYLLDATITLARRLQADGVQKGDRVAVIMRNLPEWPVAFFAGVLAGAIIEYQLVN